MPIKDGGMGTKVESARNQWLVNNTHSRSTIAVQLPQYSHKANLTKLDNIL